MQRDVQDSCPRYSGGLQGRLDSGPPDPSASRSARLRRVPPPRRAPRRHEPPVVCSSFGLDSLHCRKGPIGAGKRQSKAAERGAEMPAVSFATAVAVSCAAVGQRSGAKVKLGRNGTVDFFGRASFDVRFSSILESEQGCRTRVWEARVPACNVLRFRRRAGFHTLPRIMREVFSKYTRGGRSRRFSLVCTQTNGTKISTKGTGCHFDPQMTKKTFPDVPPEE